MFEITDIEKLMNESLEMKRLKKKFLKEFPHLLRATTSIEPFIPAADSVWKFIEENFIADNDVHKDYIVVAWIKKNSCIVEYHDGTSILYDDKIWRKEFKDPIKALAYAERKSIVPDETTLTGKRIIEICIVGFNQK